MENVNKRGQNIISLCELIKLLGIQEPTFLGKRLVIAEDKEDNND